MASYISNCPISGPIWIPYAKPDVDLNGIGWNYQWGLAFNASEPEIPIRLPSVSPQDFIR